MARTSTQQPTGTRKPRATPGQWTGDVPGFLKWCATVDDLDAYRAALAAVPPNSAWDAVSRALRAGIEYRSRPSESGSRVRPPEVFLEDAPEGAELRAAKRAILETEITRRALRYLG